MASSTTSNDEGVQIVSAKDSLYSKVIPKHLRNILSARGASKNSAAKASVSKTSSSALPTSALKPCSSSRAPSGACSVSQNSTGSQGTTSAEDGGSSAAVASSGSRGQKKTSQGADYSSSDDKTKLYRRHSSYAGTSTDRETLFGSFQSREFVKNGRTELRGDSRRLDDDGTHIERRRSKTVCGGEEEPKTKPPSKPPRRVSKEEWCPLNLSGTFRGRTGATTPIEEREAISPGFQNSSKPHSLVRQNNVTLEEGGRLVCPLAEGEDLEAERRQKCYENVIYGELSGSSSHANWPRISGNGNAISASGTPVQASSTEVSSDLSNKESPHNKDFVVGNETSDTTLKQTTASARRASDAPVARQDSAEVSSVNESVCSDGSDSLTKPESKEHILCTNNSLTVLQACGACVQPCPDPRLLLCFHIVCPKCVSSGSVERDGCQVIVCPVCEAEHASPPEGPMVLSDMYPGLLTDCSNPVACSLGNERAKTDKENVSPTSADSLLQPDVRSNSLISLAANLQNFDFIDSERNEKGTSVSCLLSAQTKEATLPESITNDNNSSDPSSKHGEDASNSDGRTGARASPSSKSPETDGLQPSAESRLRAATALEKPGETADTAETQKRLCGACQTRSDTCHTCVTCGGVLLCEACQVAHLNLPITRSHEVLPIESVSPLVLIARRQLTCSEHGQDLALTCVTCGIFLCHRCLMPQHARHEIKELASIYHAKRKQLSGLQRTIKQHVLAARSSLRSVDEQISKVDMTRQNLCDAIQTTAQRHIQRVTSLAAALTREVEQTTGLRRQRLEKNRATVTRATQEGQKLRCVLGAVTDQTPHLTSLTLLHICQARYDSLPEEAPLVVEEFEDLVFRQDPRLDLELGRERVLGSIGTVAQGIPDTVMALVGMFKVCADLSGLAVTPHGEVVCISAIGGRCQVWDCHGAMLMDASRHVTRPTAVEVPVSGIIIVLDGERSVTDSGKVKNCCLKMISPSGTLLSQIPLSSPAGATWIHCLNDATLLISDEQKKTMTLSAIEKGSSILRNMRVVTNDCRLHAPRHVTINVNDDWVVNDGGTTLKVISPDGDVSSLLCNDEFEAVLQPPRRSCHMRRRGDTRMLGDVCCDSKGRVIAADMSKCGLYVITAGAASSRERHFVPLEDLSPSSFMGTIHVDGADRIFVGMSDGTVSILKIGYEEDRDTTSVHNANFTK